MNAKQMISRLDGYGGIIPFNSEELDITLRALRLLAAAESNDGTTPETDAAFPLSVWPADFACDFARRLERERNGLAARLEIDFATDGNGKRVPFPTGGPDGIACRDETIRILESALAEAERKCERLKLTLHEIKEEWAGAECGEPATAQEGYAIELCKRMYRIATEFKEES